ncbi:c-type cytochrome [Acidiphilium sp.]|uniref:c-type cytochrome n=1 Tax=Acidiphilium sp. TaxID=527 RepID=UPI003D07B84D
MKIRPISTVIGMAIIGGAAVSMISMAGYAADNASPAAAGPAPKGEILAQGSDCFSCHAINQKIVGPSFEAVAGKFAGTKGAETTLTDAIKNGHVGTWGNIAMPAHPKLSDAKIKEIVSWILTLKHAKTSSVTTSQKYTYTVKGKTVTTDFPILQQGSDKVTPMVFRGYELFNSYCFRCHGADADGGAYAPNLRHSINDGMSESKFLSIAMTGVKAKGMPSWAGFFTPHQIKAIYQYTAARAVAVVGQGTPKH